MKNQSFVWCWLLFAALLGSCQKENLGSTPNLEVSNATLKSSGSAVVTLTNITDSTQITWSIDPAETARIVASGARASIIFSSKGHYTLTAHQGQHSFTTDIDVDSIPHCHGDSIYLDDDSLHIPHDSIPSVVTDSAGHHGNHWPPVDNDSITSPVHPDTLSHHHQDNDSIESLGNDFFLLKDDELVITPVSLVDSTGVKGIWFNARTKKMYDCSNNYLGVVANINNNKISISANYVIIPENCHDGKYQAKATFSIFPLAEGENKLEIIINGTTYIGSLNNNNGSITINWKYTNGVIFTSLVL